VTNDSGLLNILNHVPHAPLLAQKRKSIVLNDNTIFSDESNDGNRTIPAIE